MTQLQPIAATTLHRLLAESGLSHAQIAIWVGQKRHPGSPLYNMAFAFVIEGALDSVVFREAWRRVVDGSDALRTSVVERHGVAVRREGDAIRRETELVDFSSHADPEGYFRAWARERCARSLPLDGSLVDSVLVDLGGERYGWYLNQHHLVTDATSTVLLVRQVATEYAARTTQAAGGPTPSGSYYDTVHSLASYPDSTARAGAAHHWQQQLSRGERAMPLYGRRMDVSSGASDRLGLTLDEADTRRLREIAAQPGFVSFTPDISMFSLLATLLASWLHRVSGNEVVCLDAPAYNRPTPVAKRSLGLFIEMFPFTTLVEPGDSFRSLGRKCLEETGRFLRNALPGTSVPSGTTVSNVILNYFSGSFGDFAGLRLSSEWIHSGHSDMVHAVRVQVHDYDGSGRYTLHFDLNEATFDPRQRQRVLKHFGNLLQALLKDPDALIAEVDVLGDDERDALLVRFNRTDAAPLPEDPVTALFDRQADETPDRLAIRHGAREISFGELRRHADLAGGRLAALGVRSGPPVAVFMKRSIEAVTAILAVLKAGGAYVPLDPAYPDERVRHILEDSGAVSVLTSGAHAPSWASSRHRLIRVEDLLRGEWPAPAAPLSPPRLGDLAYIIYTSGSTGRPKGVLVEHAGLVDYLEWAARQYVRGDRLTFPLFTSLAFDLTVTSLFLPLMTGGTLVVYEEPDGPVDTSLLNVVAENAVDFIKLTPSHLSLLRRMDLSRSRVRRMVVGGEDFRTPLAAAMHAQLNGAIEIYNEYGPTEAVVACALHAYAPATDTGSSVPIGRPADHVQLYVLNESLAAVPEGVPGELCISRFGLARGYHSRSDTTDRQFVPHPFREGDRLYRSGDLVRFSGPGLLEYLGRIDRQLKVSGFRVEPAEIEAAVLAHAEIAECVVVPVRRRVETQARTAAFCLRCGIASNVPEVALDAEGVCSICRSFDATEKHARAYFGRMEELAAVFRDVAARKRGRYDCMMLLSGGKDSTYALCRLVDMGVAVYAFTLDNGYISEQAKDNIRRVVTALGVDHEFASTPAMPAIFRDSLERFSNVCNGCFKALYTLSMTRARELDIPIIVTGLSRGQFFETRLTERQFRDGRCSPAEIDQAVFAARKAYHRLEDAVSRSLDVSIFEDDRIFEEVRFVDFYRYCDAGLDEVLSFLERTVPWMRPSDTGRSTNCLINEVGIYVHQKERGYHNYALPYSWDVRLGHKTREEALEELHDEIDLTRVRRILAEIGYDESRMGDAGATAMAAYYRAPRAVPVHELRRHLAATLPAAFVPQYFVCVDALPLSPNGKVDLARLPLPESASLVPADDHVAPEGAAQERIARIWRDVLRVPRIGVFTSFFELGGTSIAAMEVMLRVCDEFDVDLPLQTVFQHPTVALLARAVEQRITEELASLTEEEAARLAANFPPQT